MVVAFGKEDARANPFETVLEIYHPSTLRWAAIGLSLLKDTAKMVSSVGKQV
jgi:hypothetical protein